MNPGRVDILGMMYSPVNLNRALQQIHDWIDSRSHSYICVSPAHSVMDCVQNPELYPLFNHSGMTVPDGMSVAWLLKLKGFRHVDRVAGTELLEETLSRSLQFGWKHYFYGGAPGVAEELARCIRERFPGIRTAGVFSPPFRELTEQEDQTVLQCINQSGADIVWVGISSPRQERWMHEHVGMLSAPVLIGVGAAFDFLAGSKPRAPRWMQRIGLEWLYRLYREPGRLWPRYRQYPRFVLLALAQLTGLWISPHSRDTKENG